MVKYALLKYRTWNIGDEIQSLAAKQFLPRIDTWINRDEIGAASARLSDPTRLIMNGWWLHGSDWPPRGAVLQPLLTSMYLDHRHPEARRAFLSAESRAFLIEHGPVGARDLRTLEFLDTHRIPAYFSGCLTVTLQRDPRSIRQDFIVAVDLPPDVLEGLRQRTGRRIIELTAYHEPALNLDARNLLAEFHLLVLQSASMVVTSRLHTALPSLAFDTPTVLIKTPTTFDPHRFDGLSDLVHSCSPDEFLEDRRIGDPDVFVANPKAHQEMREGLTARCVEFTGSPCMPNRVVDAASYPEGLPALASLLGDQVIKARIAEQRREVGNARRPGLLLRIQKKAPRIMDRSRWPRVWTSGLGVPHDH